MLSLKEASEMSGMSVPRILRRIKKGQIKAEKLGWQWVITEKELAKLK